jgi:queuine tRNA-ribosyltransferase
VALLGLPIDPGDFAIRENTVYLHHVFKAQEIIASMLLTWHNLHYYQELMAGLRAAIGAGELAKFIDDFEAKRAVGDAWAE